MATTKNYVKGVATSAKKNINKASKIGSQMKSHKGNNKSHILAERDELKQKIKQAEAIFKKLQSSSKDNFEEIKESASDTLDSLTEAFNDFSNLVTMDEIYHAKDEIAAYGNEKVTQVEDYIRHKPLHAAGMAFGIGLVFGIFFRRSR